MERVDTGKGARLVFLPDRRQSLPMYLFLPGEARSAVMSQLQTMSRLVSILSLKPATKAKKDSLFPKAAKRQQAAVAEETVT